ADALAGSIQKFRDPGHELWHCRFVISDAQFDPPPTTDWATNDRCPKPPAKLVVDLTYGHVVWLDPPLGGGRMGTNREVVPLEDEDSTERLEATLRCRGEGPNPLDGLPAMGGATPEPFESDALAFTEAPVPLHLDSGEVSEV